jgi:molecular chaperone GrpE
MSKKEKKTEEEPINKQNEQQAAENVAEDNATQESAETTEEDKVQELGEKLAALNDKYLRLYSEYENYRKRTNLEKADLLLNGSRDTIKAILPVIDDFERALATLGDDEGVQLIYNKMIKILEQKGLKAMSAKGEKFDENLHEAITQIPAADEAQKGIVVDVIEKGYFLNDKVLRYAKVVVAC